MASIPSIRETRQISVFHWHEDVERYWLKMIFVLYRPESDRSNLKEMQEEKCAQGRRSLLFRPQDEHGLTNQVAGQALLQTLASWLATARHIPLPRPALPAAGQCDRYQHRHREPPLPDKRSEQRTRYWPSGQIDHRGELIFRNHRYLADFSEAPPLRHRVAVRKSQSLKTSLHSPLPALRALQGFTRHSLIILNFRWHGPLSSYS